MGEVVELRCPHQILDIADPALAFEVGFGADVAVPGQVFRGGEDAQLVIDHFCGREAALGRAGHGDRQVGFAFREAEDAGIGDQFDREFWMRGAEGAQAGPQEIGAETLRRAEPHGAGDAAGAACIIRADADCQRFHRLRLGHQPFAFRGEDEADGAAVK